MEIDEAEFQARVAAERERAAAEYAETRRRAHRRYAELLLRIDAGEVLGAGEERELRAALVLLGLDMAHVHGDLLLLAAGRIARAVGAVGLARRIRHLGRALFRVSSSPPRTPSLLPGGSAPASSDPPGT